MGRSCYKIYNTEQPHFITCATVRWIPLFSNPDIVEVLLNSLSFLQKEVRLQLYAYVIMENHLHFIASSKDLQKELGNFKSFTARKIIDLLEERKSVGLLELLERFKLQHKKDRQHQLWQEGSHPEEIISEKMMIQKMEYIHNNPVRRGCVDNPTDWRYSSARNYEGKEGLITVTTEW